MAWVDKRGEFSDAQALTATAVSTNVVDLTSDRDIGPGVPLWVILTLDVASDGGNSDETYVVALQTDDNSGFSSATEIGSVTIPRGSAAGTMFSIGFPARNERYIRLNYTLGGTTPSATVSAWLTSDPPRAWTAFPDAI